MWQRSSFFQKASEPECQQSKPGCNQYCFHAYGAGNVNGNANADANGGGNANGNGNGPAIQLVTCGNADGNGYAHDNGYGMQFTL